MFTARYEINLYILFRLILAFKGDGFLRRKGEQDILHRKFAFRHCGEGTRSIRSEDLLRFFAVSGGVSQPILELRISSVASWLVTLCNFPNMKGKKRQPNIKIYFRKERSYGVYFRN